MPNFTGSLTANEIYTALYNMIISQRVYDISTANPSLANALRVDGTLYGDTKLYHSMDIGKSYDWQNDAEASNLLTLNRNKTQYTQAIKLDKFRQTSVTVDNYLSKRAWMTEGSFSDFNGVLISSLSGVKRIYDNGIVNTFVGTQTSTASAANITLPAITAGEGNVDAEAVNRLTGQNIAKTFADLAVNLGDNNRYFNELNFTRSVPIEECIVVWNSDHYNKLLNIDLPTIFHNDGLKPKANFVLPARFFGTVNASIATGNTDTVTTADGRTVPGPGASDAVRSLIEQTIGTGDNAVHYFPGDAIATGVNAPAKTSYTQSDTTVCKVFPTEAVPFMSSFETGTMFNNPRSLTDTHYLTWGHNTLERILEKPFVTIKTADPATPSDPSDPE